MSVEQILQTVDEQSPAPKLRMRVRIRFTKAGRSALDQPSRSDARLERLFRRAGVALSMSEGFHPKPRMNFPSALAVGIAGLDEVMEVDLAEPHTAESLRAMIEPQLPPGMKLGAIEVLPAPDRKAQVTHVTFAAVDPAGSATGTEQIESPGCWQQPQFAIARDGRTTPLDLRPLIDEFDDRGRCAAHATACRSRRQCPPARSARGTWKLPI